MKKVLVVDDSESARQQVGLVLTRAGYSVVEAVDGMEGLAALQEGGITIVLTDVNMPRMNGLEMLESLRRDPAHATTPVVMLTLERHPALIDRAKQAGAQGWIVKPFNAENLLSEVDRLVGA
jgi:two-component system chemotaxis response regulator CheY